MTTKQINLANKLMNELEVRLPKEEMTKLEIVISMLVRERDQLKDQLAKREMKKMKRGKRS